MQLYHTWKEKVFIRNQDKVANPADQSSPISQVHVK